MKLVRRILFICFLLIAVLCGAFWLAVRYLPETELMRTSVQDKLREVTGSDISIGSLRITSSLADPICLDVERITLISGEKGPHASAERIVLSPSLYGLLNRELTIRHITVNGLRITVEQDSDGQIRHPFVSTVTQSPSAAADNEERTVSVAFPGRPVDPAAETVKTPPPAESALKWSVKSVKLVDGRVDWIDRKIVPGRETVLSLTSLTGSLEDQSGQDGVVVKISSRLDLNGSSIGPVALEGLTAAVVDGRFPERGTLSVASDRLLIKPLQTLLPAWLGASDALNECSARVSVNWEKDRIPGISVTTKLRDVSGHSADLVFEGEIEPCESLSGIKRIGGVLRGEGIPLRYAAPLLPAQFPIDPENGTINSALDLEWSRDQDLQIRGKVSLENLKTVAAWKQLADQVRVEGDLQLDQQALILRKLEVWGSAKLASVTGKIEQPFSSKRTLDLSGEAILPSGWVKDVTSKSTKAVSVKGSVSVSGAVRGPADEPAFELSGDMTSMGIQWLPHLEKSPGNKATVWLKGKIVPARGGQASKSTMNGRAQIEMAGARIRLNERAPWIEKNSLRLDSKVIFNGSNVDLRDATLSIKGGPNSREILTAGATVGDMASSAPRIDGHVSAIVDRELLTLAGVQLPADLSITGKTKVRAGFMGNPKELTWTLDLPLANVDIAVSSTFRKPAAVAGSFKAAGKWAGEELRLTNGGLTLPGVTMRLDGNLVGRDGKFHTLTVNLNRADAKDVARYFPTTAGSRFSGPVEGVFHLKSGDKGVATSGMVRLVAMDCQPEKAPWGLEKLQGTIQMEAGSLVSEGIAGRIRGTIEAPLKVNGALNNISSLEAMSGHFAVKIGQGRIKAESVRSTLNQARLLVGTLLNPQGQISGRDLLEFESLTGDFEIKSASARTENLQLRGSDFNAAAVGSLRLDNMSLDGLVGIHTVTVVGDTLGKIPEVQKFVKKHEDILKRTGLDKELGRIGIRIPTDAQSKPERQETVRTSVTLIAKVQGPASSPQVTPVLEGSLNKNTLARLKSLMN